MSGCAIAVIAVAAVAVIALVVIIVNSRKPTREEAPPPPPPVTRKVTLYNNGSPIASLRATTAYSSESGGYAYVEGNPEHYTIFGGTFVIEPIDAPDTAPRQPDSKFKVTLYDGGGVIREWYALSAYSSKSGAYLYTKEGEEYTCLGGTFLVEPLA